MAHCDIRIIASCKEDMQSLFRVFAIIQKSGERGHGVDIPLFVDGDGSGHYKFQIKNEEGALENIETDGIDLDKKINTIWLGE